MIKLTAGQFWDKLVNVTGDQSGRFFIRRKNMKGLRHMVAAAVVKAYYPHPKKRATIVAMPATHHEWRSSGLGWRQHLSPPMEVSRGKRSPHLASLLVIDELPAHAYHGRLLAGLGQAVEVSKKANGPVILFVLNEDPPPKLLTAWLAESNFEEIEIAGDHD